MDYEGCLRDSRLSLILRRRSFLNCGVRFTEATSPQAKVLARPCCDSISLQGKGGGVCLSSPRPQLGRPCMSPTTTFARLPAWWTQSGSCDPQGYTCRGSRCRCNFREMICGLCYRYGAHMEFLIKRSECRLLPMNRRIPHPGRSM